MKCKDCKWFKGYDSGQCRKHSPIPISNLIHYSSPKVPRNPYPDEIISAWPCVRNDDFCGDYEHREISEGAHQSMDNISIGDKVGLSWIQGHGNAKVVGIYQDYVMAIHYYKDKPFVVHKSDIVPPENDRMPMFMVEQIKEIICNDIQRNGPIRKAIKNI